jgi:predicted nucleic acid-binding Zn ribbon protein
MDRLIKTLPAILKASGASDEVAEAACIAAWRHAVGEALSSHAAPLLLQNKSLVVVVGDNIWKGQLEQMRAQLLFRLNQVMGQETVKSIEFRVDAKALARMRDHEAGKGKARDSAASLDYQVPAELLSAAAGIEDVELRRAFLGAATSCVRRLEESET